MNMPGLNERRTYTLRSTEAADDYSQHWLHQEQSLTKYNVVVKAVWISRANPKQVIALLQYPVDNDPADIMDKYMNSEAFNNDMAGFDGEQIEKVETSVWKSRDSV